MAHGRRMLGGLVMALAGGGAAAPPAPETAVRVRTFRFAPETVTVAAGTRVRWTNDDEIEHTIASGAPERRDARFTSGVLAGKGTAHAAVFATPGAYPYHCERHAFMRGEVHVTPTGDHP